MYILRRHSRRVYSTTPATSISSSTAALVSGWKAQIAPRIDTSTDHISPSAFNLLATTLDDPAVPYKGDSLPPAGTPLPPNWHLAYFPPRILERDLSLDGYDTNYSPPEPFVQRMWAGGKIEWSRENPLKVGQEARMVAKLKDVEMKRGGKGENVFVWVDRDVGNEAGWCLKDTRCLVYMQKTKEGTGRTEPRVVLANKTPDFTRTLHPTTILLFRYSALTFNSHMIHYDHLYSTTKEGHPACLVHGPLTCTLLLDLLRCNLPTERHIKSFSYRALSPLVVGKGFRVCGRRGSEGGYELWAENDNGGLAMTGTAEVEV